MSTERVSGPDTLPNAIMVCGLCGKLCLASDDQWSGSGSKDNISRHHMRRQTMSSKLYKKVILHNPCLKNWKYDEKLEQSTSKSNYYVFPCCNNCCVIQSNGIFNQKKYYDNESIYLLKQIQNPNTKNICKILRDKVRKLDNEAQIINEVSECLERDMFHKKFVGKSDRFANMISTISNEYHLPSNSDQISIYSNSEINTMNIMLSTTFSIGFWRHYGTINGVRLGYQTPDPIPDDELDVALFFFAQLIQSLGSLARMDFTHVSIGSNVNICYLQSKTIRLNSALFKSRNTAKELNEVMHDFMCFLSAVFSAIVSDDLIPPLPFKLNVNNRTIADISYDFDIKKPSKWTKAMRLLLFNIKSIQLRSLSNAVKNYVY